MGLKLNGIHQLLANAGDLNLLEVNKENIREESKTLTGSTKKDDTERNAKKTKRLLQYHGQNIRQNDDKKIANETSENVKDSKYLGTMVTN
jgi:hypothetical protein